MSVVAILPRGGNIVKRWQHCQMVAALAISRRPKGGNVAKWWGRVSETNLRIRLNGKPLRAENSSRRLRNEFRDFRCQVRVRKPGHRLRQSLAHLPGFEAPTRRRNQSRVEEWRGCLGEALRVGRPFRLPVPE